MTCIGGQNAEQNSNINNNTHILCIVYIEKFNFFFLIHWNGMVLLYCVLSAAQHLIHTPSILYNKANCTPLF